MVYYSYENSKLTYCNSYFVFILFSFKRVYTISLLQLLNMSNTADLQLVSLTRLSNLQGSGHLPIDVCIDESALNILQPLQNSSSFPVAKLASSLYKFISASIIMSNAITGLCLPKFTSIKDIDVVSLYCEWMKENKAEQLNNVMQTQNGLVKPCNSILESGESEGNLRSQKVN